MSGYQRINFKDQNVERPKTYDVTNNPDGSITLIESFGNVEELGTPINQENMNHIEDGIDAVSFSKFNTDSVYKKDDLVTDIQGGELKIFKSLKDNNFSHLPSEDDYWEEVEISGGGSGFNLFDTKISDHILQGNEAKGWALQGTYVTKDLYPDFYNKCLEEKTASAENEVTLGDSALVMYVNSNGHQFFDIADKPIVDSFYDTYGIADFYGIDTENERVFLPRNKYFHQLTDDVSKVNVMIEAGLPNITGGFTMEHNAVQTKGAFYNGATVSGKQGSSGGDTDAWFNFDASRSSSIYGKSDTVQVPSSLKLLYYCVGNQVVNEAEIDAGGLVVQMELKANVSLDNVNQQAKELMSNMSLPSDEYINLTIGASNSTYTMPENGYLTYIFNPPNDTDGTQSLTVTNNTLGNFGITSFNIWGRSAYGFLPVRKNDEVNVSYSSGTVSSLRLYKLKGEV